MPTYKTVYGKEVYVTQRLKYCPSGQCGMLRQADGTINLISYSTVVCSIDKNGWLSCTGVYSVTTRKHIAAFLREFAPQLNYHIVKHCYEHNEKVQIHTGEVVPLSA